MTTADKELVEKAQTLAARADEPEVQVSMLGWLYISLYWIDHGRGRVLDFLERRERDPETAADIVASLRQTQPPAQIARATVEMLRPALARLAERRAANVNRERRHNEALGTAAAVEATDGRAVEPRGVVSGTDIENYKSNLVSQD